LIAIALTTNPQLLIMDEPTTGLDVTTEAVILDLIQELLQQYQSAVLYITHNLGVVARICDWVGVMYAGELLEEGPVQDVFKRSLHPYALGLLGCVPRLDANKDRTRLHTIPGYIPRPDELPGGCVFAPRCILAEEACRQARPPLAEVGPRHWTACRRWPDVQRDRSRFVRVHERSSETAAVQAEPVVLEAIGVKKFFKNVNRMELLSFAAGRPQVRAVDDISILSRRGLTVGIVGESGCGKTTLARCIVGLEEPTAGEVKLEDRALPPAVAQRVRPVLKKLQMVFQNPDASLNPQHTVGEIIGRPLVLFGKLSKVQVSARVSELLEAVNLPASYVDRLPHELSGGEKQRVAIARAFAAEPVVLICDEPISALDVSVQASLINLLVELQAAKGTAYLFISHDLSAVRHISDWIVIVYLGRLWEVGPAAKVFAPPMHPYTEALLSAIPIPHPDARQERIRLEGSVPSAVNIPSGCRFHTRCPRKIGPICETEEPPWQDDGADHRICCHIPLDALRELQKGVLQLAASQDAVPATGSSPGE